MQRFIEANKYRQDLYLNSHKPLILQSLKELEHKNIGRRLWSKDVSLWKTEPAHEKIIKNSLGWLTVPELMSEKIKELVQFAEEVKSSGIKDVVLLGMGGSSLASEVFRLSLPSKSYPGQRSGKGYPKLHVLDSTDPYWVADIEKSVQLKKTLFILSSKSGTTTEPLAFYQYFFERVKQNGRQFIAITDPGSYLEKMARERGFLKTFLNPSDIGGRFSALSYFGLVPAALAGKDVEALIKSALSMMKACGPKVPVTQNPAIALGTIIGQFAKEGKDKLTLLLPKKLESLGLWIEQLIAESSGKEGKGIVPITGESLAKSEVYGNDRLFVAVDFVSGKDKKLQKKVKELSKQFPLVTINMHKPEDLGAEFLRWEIATAIACSLIKVDAFDQPDVQSAKDLTKSVLNRLTETGTLPKLHVHFRSKKFKATLSEASLKCLEDKSVVETMRAFVGQARSGDYFGVLAFLPFSAETDQQLDEIRSVLRNKTKRATLFGYGPRYLHSTGQLHKGGANNGIFLVLTAEPKKDLKVPNQSYSFGQLEEAQAIGDFQALDTRGRRALYLQLALPIKQSLAEIIKLLKQ